MLRGTVLQEVFEAFDVLWGDRRFTKRFAHFQELFIGLTHRNIRKRETIGEKRAVLFFFRTSFLL